MDYNESSSIHSGLYKSGYLTQRGFQKEEGEEEKQEKEEEEESRTYFVLHGSRINSFVRERLARVAQSCYQDQQCTVGDFLHDGVHLPHAPSAVTDLC